MNGRLEEGRDGRVGGEFHSCYESCKQAGQITEEEYEKLDQLHYRVENELLKLMGSLQKSKRLEIGKTPCKAILSDLNKSA